MPCSLTAGATCVPTHSSLQTDAKVDRLLLTHFHRDQCAGATHWQQEGAQVVMPFAERRFFEESDLLRAGYDVFDNYTAFYPTYGPLQDLRDATYARDYTRLRLGRCDL